MQVVDSEQETWDYVHTLILDKVRTPIHRLALHQTMQTVRVKRAKLYEKLTQERRFKTLSDSKKKLLRDMVGWIKSGGRD